jgi:glycosyltransferase involved in cell wall biosynthesis
MTSENHPLVSCICLTRNNVEFLQRSIRCFHDQTYGNKELIVAFTADNEAAIRLMERIEHPLVRPLIFSSKPTMTLGEKRNAAIRHAHGQYVCIWDDDDWHHIKRIETHATALSNTQYMASILSNVILYDNVSKASYVSATRWGWEQTLFCQKSFFDSGNWYESLNRGEDSSLVYNLKQNDLLLSMASPHLYIYVYHGGNVFHRGHWDVNLLPWARRMTTSNASVIADILNGIITNTDAPAVLEKFC